MVEAKCVCVLLEHEFRSKIIMRVCACFNTMSRHCGAGEKNTKHAQWLACYNYPRKMIRLGGWGIHTGSSILWFAAFPGCSVNKVWWDVRGQDVVVVK